MVAITLPLSFDIINTPAKFITAASIMAFLGLMARVDMQVAMAVGASVQPFTRITPEMSITERLMAGLVNSMWIKSDRRNIHHSSNAVIFILPMAVSKGIFNEPLKVVNSFAICSFSAIMSERMAFTLSEND